MLERHNDIHRFVNDIQTLAMNVRCCGGQMRKATDLVEEDDIFERVRDMVAHSRDFATKIHEWLALVEELQERAELPVEASFAASMDRELKNIFQVGFATRHPGLNAVPPSLPSSPLPYTFSITQEVDGSFLLQPL